MNADEEVVGLLRDIKFALLDMTSLLKQQLAASEAPLYCPPSEHCAGGHLLAHSTVFEDDVPEEKRRDKFYHPLPEKDWYDVETKQGTLHVRNHNVWRSRALRDAGAAQSAPVERDANFDEDVPARDVSQEAPTFRHVGDLLTWANKELGMARPAVLARLGVSDVADITDLEGAAYTLGSKQEAGVR